MVFRDRSIPDMPQTAERIGDRIKITCRLGLAPVHSFEFPLSEWPTDTQSQLNYVRALALAREREFYSNLPPAVQGKVNSAQVSAIRQAAGTIERAA